MVALDDFPQLPPVHVGVDLGGADVGVAEKFLNHPEANISIISYCEPNFTVFSEPTQTLH